MIFQVLKKIVWAGLLGIGCFGGVDVWGETRPIAHVTKNQDGGKMIFEQEKCELYNGYQAHHFTFDGCPCIVVEPKTPQAGRRWVWKAEFFSAFPKFELEMLRRGYYLVYMNVGNTFGCPDAMKHFDRFYELLTGQYEFYRRPILLGLSRGGLYIYNWAVAHPDKVGCIYADNAVCDFKSWPAGKGRGVGSPKDWAKLQQDYHFASEAEALAYPNPIDRVKCLVDAKIPLVHAAGVDDITVPIEENTDVMEKRVREAGGTLKVFRHTGDHHPHGLDDPTPLADWIEKHAL